MKNARFCSRKCYVKAWPKLNREKWNAIRRQNRLDHIEKSRKKDRVYKDTYMRKMIGSRPWRKTMMSRQKDAAGRGLEFELTDEWAAARWTGFCEVTGLPFRTSGTEKGPHPYSASIDRIDQKIGYTQDNSRIVLWAINAFRGRGDDATMMEIARALVARGNNPQ